MPQPQVPQRSSEVTEVLSDSSRSRRDAARAARARQFIRGPLPMAWMEKAANLPGKAMSVGLLLWFKHGMSGDKPLKLTPTLLKRFGIGRKAGYRAISALEAAGLVHTERHPGRCAEVTLIFD